MTIPLHSQVASETLIIWQLEEPLKQLAALLHIDATDLQKAIQYKDANPIKMFLHLHFLILITQAKIQDLTDQTWQAKNLLNRAEQTAEEATRKQIVLDAPDFASLRKQLNLVNIELDAKKMQLQQLEDERQQLSNEISENCAQIKKQVKEFITTQELLMTEAEIDRGIKDTLLEVKKRSKSKTKAKTTIDKKSKQYRFDGVLRYLEGIAAVEVFGNG